MPTEHGGSQDTEGDEARPSAASDPLGDLSEGDPGGELQMAIEKLEQDLDETKADLMRTVADLQTYRRRSVEEIRSSRVAGKADIVSDLIPVVESMQLSLAAIDSGATPQSIRAGVDLIAQQFRAALEAHGVEPIRVDIPFDPNFHEAVASEHTDRPEGTILETLEAGYRIGNRIVRPAKVRVSQGPGA